MNAILSATNPGNHDQSVDPRDTLPQLAVWSTFNIFGAVSMSIVLAISLCVPHLRRVWLLVNLELFLMISCATGSILVWTGHALDRDPPRGLCTFNAAVTMSNVTGSGFAAFALVLGVNSYVLSPLKMHLKPLNARCGHKPWQRPTLEVVS
jgi:hypothetical protein